MTEGYPQEGRSKAQAGGRRRGGLGRGLGALIPTTEEPQETPERPLDVLFPDLEGDPSRYDQRRSVRTPGGVGTRDLLGPPQRARSVSRETTRTKRGGSSESDRNGSGAMRPSVSRETFGEDGSLGEVLPVPGARIRNIPPAWVLPNTKQPRQVFEQSDLDELAASIREVGVLQPPVVRPIKTDEIRNTSELDALRVALEEHPEARYELVMGERRWRAAQQAGLSELPVIIRETDHDQMLRQALVENLHRAQLNPLEEAAAYSQLMDDFKYTQEELASAVARSRPQVANMLRLLRLPPNIQKRVAAGVISAGHARALLSLVDEEQMEQLAQRIVHEGLSVRSTEEIARALRSPRFQRRPRLSPLVSDEAQEIADRLADRLETGVKVMPGKTRSKLVIEFADQADLDRIFEALQA